MKKKFFKQHYSGLWVARDGEVFVPKSGKRVAHYTYGNKNSEGYRKVGYKGKQYLVHRLVAEVYIPNFEGKKEVDHINTVRTDNRVENLRWVTRGENSNNSMSRQHYSEAKKGKKQSVEHIRKRTEAKKKPIIGVNKETGEIVEFESATDAWLTLNINSSHITQCCKGRYKSAGGYVWRYA